MHRMNGLLALGLIVSCGGGDDDAVSDAGIRDGGVADAAMRDAGADARADPGAGDAGDSCTRLPEVIDGDTSVGPGCVRVDRTVVRDAAALTIAPGTEVRFVASGYLNVTDTSALSAVGTEASPIRFTSDAESPLAGDWQCIRIGDEAAASEIRHVVMEYGGAPCEATGADFETMLDVHVGVRAIDDVTFRHSATHGLLLQREASVRSFQDNIFSDNGEASILVSAAQLVSIGAPNRFEDPDDAIVVDTTFGLQRSGTIRRQEVPYRVVGKLDIQRNAEVTVEAGTVLAMTGSSVEVFGATLTIAGTADAPVTFTSAAESPVAGDWGCVWFTSTSGTPRVEHAIFEYAGSGAGCSGANYEAALVVPGDGAMVTNTVFRHVRGAGVLSQGDCNATQWCTNTFHETVTGGPLVCNFDTPSACP